MYNELLIGASSIDITPPAGATLVGYKPRVSSVVDHDLEAGALYCGDGRDEWLIVVADFLGIRKNEAANARSMISEATQIDVEAITICGTHTHSGPAVVLAETADLSECDREYLADLREKLVEVASEAKKRAAPGRFEAGSAPAYGFGSNRRIMLADGTWTNEWRDPEGTHPGFFDANLVVTVVVRPSGIAEAALVNYGVHPVVLGPESLAISADYPGYLKDAVRESLGVEHALFLLAGAGNINPRNCIQCGSEHPRSMGAKLADIATGIPRHPVDAGAVSSSRTEWTIIRDRDAYKRAGLKGQQKGDVIRTDICVFRAGGLSITTVPGELFSEYNEAIRNISTTDITLVATLADDYIGYIPTDRAQLEGAYETLMAPSADLENVFLSRIREGYDAL